MGYSIFIFFLLCFINFSSGNVIESEGEDFNNWVSWNMMNYKTKAIFKSKLLPSVDTKLQEAEMNKTTLIINQHGNESDFKTIGEALDSIPSTNTRRVILIIKPGFYREKILIGKKKSFIMLLGDPENPPTISWNATSSDIGTDDKKIKTYGSATVGVNSDYFIAINIIFENTATFNDGVKDKQAVAFRISGNKAAMYNCIFIGNQDTLYDHKGVHYFNNCTMQGSVDFIFGYGKSLYENCILHSTTNNTAMTAQKRNATSMDSGFSFINSAVTGSGGYYYLGRPWGEYAKVVFSYTYMDKWVFPEGWQKWNDERNISKVFYGEYKCSGPGSNTVGRVPWARVLTDEEAKPFIGIYYIDGESWLPKLNITSSKLA